MFPVNGRIGLTEQQFSVLERTLKSHNDGEDLYPADKAFMFYVDSPDAILHVTKPIGITSGPMTDKVMELAVSVWNFYEEGFEEYFKEIVSNNNPALCLYDKHGEPVGWVLQHMTGDIGLLYVVPEHRGKGYGKYLLSTMAKINCERNGFAFSFAQTWNEKSCRLHEFVGMKKHSDIYLKQHFRFNPENERLKIKTLPSSGNGIRQCTT
ncbi:hypothetical protein KUTeg_004301 [Tegillarca granosa]|uniref:Glycine N-acyltransferase-like protein n=1 Tax=Tegillarca granosa TaxID=220873 RepID=A0ABQ9FSF8_TEGGR|nr:hypothetical protein KUTeg_004301 [Tegillarca granosa]